MAKKQSVRQATFGLDFGTSTTLFTERTAESPSPISIGDIEAWMPSDAWFDPDSNAFVVGERAEERLPASLLIRSVKTQVTEGADRLTVRSDEAALELDPMDVISAILTETSRRVAATSPQALGSHALHVGCPAMWTGAQRRRLMDAAAGSGFNVNLDQMLDEPVAAGISWAWERNNREGRWPEGQILVLDFGGGTLDAAVLLIENNGEEVTVLSAEALGAAGDKVDDAIFGHLEEMLEEQGTDLHSMPDRASAEVLLRRTARELKHLLSDEGGGPERTVRPPGGDLPVITYSRSSLEEAMQPSLRNIDRLVEWVLRAAQLRKRTAPDEEARTVQLSKLTSEIDHVVLVGGMSREPSIHRHLTASFPHADVATVANPQEAVGAGLALSSAFDGLNLHRPAFNVKAAMLDGKPTSEELLYEAFSPLYSPNEVLRGETHLGKAVTISCPLGTSNGRVKVVLSFESLGGKKLKLVGSNGAELPEALLDPGRSIPFKLYADGQIVFGTQRFRLDRWPVIRSAGFTIPFHQEETKPEHPDRGSHWWGERP